jgi:hypothetical protein
MPYQVPKIIDINIVDVSSYYIYTSKPVLFFEYNIHCDIKSHYNNIINNHNSVVYYYKPHVNNYNNEYIYNYLLIMHSLRFNLPIVTSKNKYFKPFQYSIHDITLYKYNYPFKDIEETTIERNSLHFLIDNDGKKNIIRI